MHSAGLEPSLGLLHAGRRRSAGLVFDLMEPFRQPVVDKTVLGLLGRGDLETRLVAVHPALGIVGTKTVHRFNTRLSALAIRCVEHLAGAVDLFPLIERPTRTCRIQIPGGAANLTFDSSAKSALQGRRTPLQENRAKTSWSSGHDVVVNVADCKGFVIFVGFVAYGFRVLRG